jgi:SAM-dependent methyltransferase
MANFFFAPAAYHNGSFATQQADCTAAVLEAAGVAEATRVLDVGCGSGQTLRVVESLNDAADLLGLDPDAAACSQGRQRGERARFLQGEGERLPLADSCVSHVICRVALNYMHQGRALAEMARVLRPGGKLVLSYIAFGYSLWEMLRPEGGGPRQRLGCFKGVLAGLALQVLGRQARRGTFWGRSVPYTAPRRLRRQLRTLGCDFTWSGAEGHFLGWTTIGWAVFSKRDGSGT